MKNMVNKYRFTQFIGLLIFSVSLFVTCQKDVDPIISRTGINLSSFVINSESREAIPSADVFVDGVVRTQSDVSGSFTLENLQTGEYKIEISKSGFSSGFYTLNVENCQGTLPVFTLKTIAPPVEVDNKGGIVPAFYSSGKLAAELSIPANSIQGKKKISSTVLLGNEVPSAISSTELIQGTVIEFSSEDNNVTIENAEITLVLPYTLRPGDKVEIMSFNKTTQKWEKFLDAIVEPDGITVKVPVNNLGIYSVNLNGSYIETERVKVNCEVVGNSTNYLKEYEWTSYLNYLTTIPGNDATSVQEVKIYLNQLIEMYSKHVFSKITYKGLPAESFSKSMISNITDPPLANPGEYNTLKVRAWELVRHDCLVTNKVILRIFDLKLNAYVNHEVISKYLTSYFDWAWRADDTYNICDYTSCSSGRVVVPVNPQHTGGGTN